MPDVTVLLRTLNPGDDLSPLLDALHRQSLPPREILMIDSGSTDGSPDRARAAGARVVALAPERFTHAVSTNLGFREARGELVAMLSQDAFPVGPRWLERLTAPFADASVAAAFGRQLPRPACFPVERWELERNYPETGTPAAVYSNVNSAARRSVWAERPFDEGVAIAEDRFWALAVRERGLRVVYVPGAAVIHSHRYTLRQVYARCRAEARARARAEGVREGWNVLVKGWPRQTARDAARLRAEGELGAWPRAALYRFAQLAGIVAGGRA